MGEVIAFGLPVLRARRKPTSGFCEVTVLPARLADERDAMKSHRSPKRGSDRKPDGPKRPAGVGAK